MDTSAEESRARTTATYNAAADTFDHPALSFWDRFGRRTVDRLALRPGETVLDVCCGSGASAIPAAMQVGPAGRVVGVDLADNLLQLARAKARRLGLENLELRCGDFQQAAAGETYDAVSCVFGIFFLPDMVAGVASLWRAVRPGGRLAITTWGASVFEPACTIFWEAVRAERPDLYKGFNAWDRVTDPADVKRLLEEGGVRGAAVVEERGDHPIAEPEDWWRIVMGSGYRGTVEQLDEGARNRVREACLDFARRTSLRALSAGVVYAVAAKPA